MSELSAPPDETGEALSRLANYGEKKKRSGSWAPLVLITVLLIPLAAVGWVYWQQIELRRALGALGQESAATGDMATQAQQQFTEAQQQLEEARQQLADVQQRLQEQDAAALQTLDQELAASRASLATQSEQLAAVQAELAETRSHLDSLDTRGSPLSEAEVLLRFAQQRLVMARDASTAIALFQAADTVLRDAGDPALGSVRESLAREVAALQALPVVDVAGLFARLSAEVARVENLAVISSATVQDFAVSPVASAAQAGSDWWTRAKESLGEYFVVTHDTGLAVPQLNARDQFQMRALVQLHIEQAKLALLRGEEMLYQSALDEALMAAPRWLRSDAAGYAEFVAALESLRDTPITVAIPASDATLTALRRLSGTTANAVNGSVQ